MADLGTCHGFSGCQNKVHAVPDAGIMSCGGALRWRSTANRQRGMAWWRGMAKGRTESQKMAGCVSRALGGLSPQLSKIK